MRIVTRDELMKEPKGTPFFEFFPDAPHSITLMRFDGVSDGGGDFLESTIGPHWIEAGYSREIRKQHVSIDTHNGREGCFDDNAVYIVLDPPDIVAMIAQLNGQSVVQQHLVI
jgi:hypothetical protein